MSSKSKSKSTWNKDRSPLKFKYEKRTRDPIIWIFAALGLFMMAALILNVAAAIGAHR